MKTNDTEYKGQIPTHGCSKVVFVIGAGHSGTTLLGMMLGSHKDALFAGELQEYGLQGNRTCRTCGEDCAVWSTLDAQNNIYDELACKSGKSIIIDTSKKIHQWIRPAVDSLAHRDISLVFLTRDPRAIVASEKRKQPAYTATEIIAQWRGQMRRCEMFACAFPGPVVRVQYEALATNPKETLKTVCNGIDLQFNDQMLNPWDTPGHQVGGNIGVWAIASGKTSILSEKKFLYYGSHSRAIKLDERWKQELDVATVQEIQDAAKSLFYTYGWKHYND